MIRTMTTAVNTMNQLQNNLDIIGNNLSNIGTHGYQSNQASFQEMLYQQFNNDKADNAPRQSPEGIRYGVGAMLGQTQMNWKVGTLQQTGRNLDFALTEPKQYFNVIVQGADGPETVYTRQGNFYLSPGQGNRVALVDGEGNAVADRVGNAITFNGPVDSVQLKSDGTLVASSANRADQTAELAVTLIERPNLMTRLSSTHLTLPANLEELNVTEADILTEITGQEVGVQQGALEGSNVDYQKEMTDLINVQRAYQFNSRTVSIADQMLGLVNNIR
ncbi:flagellar hook-basal body protein [Sporosarcina aquimarina]|uniref:flagellar hook-basal body protein n=1 Tax=Sporosarcina aquimarina TaxID=114975 RepID=UPI002041D3BF|nr:flagellar hook-basal body protein [Sporosarcina aquimarina]MCM3756095.1 flagellar hook-basal body protein [Sporosarcina aquimarina]